MKIIIIEKCNHENLSYSVKWKKKKKKKSKQKNIFISGEIDHLVKDDCELYRHHQAQLILLQQECRRMKKNSKFYPESEMKKPQQRPR